VSKLPRVILGEPSPFDDREGAVVHTPFDTTWIEKVKALPRDDRQYLSWEKAWWVAEAQVDDLLDALEGHFGAVEVVDEDGVVETRSAGARTQQPGLF
jgi:hypothetical protein